MAERIYWADAKLNVIGSADFEGKGVQIILRELNEQLRQPYSIAVFEVKKIQRFLGSTKSPKPNGQMTQWPNDPMTK